MKKILTLFLLLFLITGCSNVVTYEFSNETITSNVSINFNRNEFKTFYNDTGGHSATEVESESEYDNIIYNRYQSTGVIALLKDSDIAYYDSIDYQANNGEYTFKYRYEYTYENFQDSYYINDCFDFFTVYEDDNYYHYKISGDYTCELTSLKLEIQSEKKTISSNADEIKENVHIWNIKEKDNDISFLISKADYVENNSFSTIKIIGLTLVIILVIFSLIFYKAVKKKNDF